VESALLVGGIYSTTQLAALTGNSLSKLVRLTCDIAMAYLFERRPLYDNERAGKLHDRVKDQLDRLRKGENVFNLAENIEAGKPTVDGPTTLDYQNLNLVRDRVRNYYPGRRLPGNR